MTPRGFEPPHRTGPPRSYRGLRVCLIRPAVNPEGRVGRSHRLLRLSAADLALEASPIGRSLSFQKVLECDLQPHDVSESGRHLQDPSEDSQLA